MGKSIPMQPWITLKGATTSTEAIIQPVQHWLNAESFKEVLITSLS